MRTIISRIFLVRERLGLFSYAICFFILPLIDLLGKGAVVDPDLFLWVSVVAIFSPLLNLGHYTCRWCYFGYSMNDIYTIACVVSMYGSCLLIAIYPPLIILVWGYWMANILHYPFWQYIAGTRDFANEKWMVFSFLTALVFVCLYLCINGSPFIGMFATGLVMGLIFFGFLITRGNPEI